jgi:hypothetical protein
MFGDLGAMFGMFGGVESRHQQNAARYGQQNLTRKQHELYQALLGNVLSQANRGYFDPAAQMANMQTRTYVKQDPQEWAPAQRMVDKHFKDPIQIERDKALAELGLNDIADGLDFLEGK